MRRVLYLLALAAILTGIQHTSALAQPASTATVKAVLFYSPTCPHCHAVINDTILPLMNQYGEDFVVIGIDISAISLRPARRSRICNPVVPCSPSMKIFAAMGPVP